MYNKLFAKIVTSSIWLEPTPTRMIWITFLAVMDQDGFAPFASVANLAHTARIDIEDAREAVNILESPDKDSGDPDHEGRRIERVPGGWMVLNAAKYRDIVTRQVAREKTRERVARFRAKRSCNADVTVANVLVTQSEADAESNTDSENLLGDGAKAPRAKSGKKSSSRSQIGDFELSAELKSHAEGKLAGVDAEELFRQFKDHHKAKATVMADWSAAWRTWVTNALKWGYPRLDQPKPGRPVWDEQKQLVVLGPNKERIYDQAKRQGINFTSQEHFDGYCAEVLREMRA